MCIGILRSPLPTFPRSAEVRIGRSVTSRRDLGPGQAPWREPASTAKRRTLSNSEPPSATGAPPAGDVKAGGAPGAAVGQAFTSTRVASFGKTSDSAGDRPMCTKPRMDRISNTPAATKATMAPTNMIWPIFQNP